MSFIVEDNDDLILDAIRSGEIDRNRKLKKKTTTYNNALDYFAETKKRELYLQVCEMWRLEPLDALDLSRVHEYDVQFVLRLDYNATFLGKYIDFLCETRRRLYYWTDRFFQCVVKYYVDRKQCNTLFDTNIYRKLVQLTSTSHKCGNLYLIRQLLELEPRPDYLNEADADGRTALNNLLELQIDVSYCGPIGYCEWVLINEYTDIAIKMIDAGYDIKRNKSLLESLCTNKCICVSNCASFVRYLIKIGVPYNYDVIVALLGKLQESDECIISFNSTDLMTLFDADQLSLLLTECGINGSFDLCAIITEYNANPTFVR